MEKEVSELLKRREELIERKRKVAKAIQRVNEIKEQKEQQKKQKKEENTLIPIKETEEEEEEEEAREIERIEEETECCREEEYCHVLKINWNNFKGILSVLTTTELIIKSIHKPQISEHLKLPLKADKSTELFTSNNLSVLDYRNICKCCLLHRDSDKWRELSMFENGYKVVSVLGNDRVVILNGEGKLMVIGDAKNEMVLHVIEDVKMVYSFDNVNGLIVKFDGSLTICNFETFNEIVYLPKTLKPSTFNPKQIVYFNCDQEDSTLFMVLFDKFCGKLRVFVCGVGQEGVSEMATISISKDTLWLIVENPYIIHQDTKLTVHILSLFTLVEERNFPLSHKIHSFSMLNKKNLLFLLENGEFVHYLI